MRARNIALLVIGIVLIVGSSLLIHWRYALHLDIPPPVGSMAEDPLQSTSVNILYDAGVAGFLIFLTGAILAIADSIRHFAKRTS